MVGEEREEKNVTEHDALMNGHVANSGAVVAKPLPKLFVNQIKNLDVGEVEAEVDAEILVRARELDEGPRGGGSERCLSSLAEGRRGEDLGLVLVDAEA